MSRNDKLKRDVVRLAKRSFEIGLPLLDGSIPYELSDIDELSFHVKVKDPGKGSRWFEVRVKEGY